jgi:short subunit dehydrogenase-like uncharacterized protein
MNPNDLITQQQALHQNVQYWQYAGIVIWLASVLVAAWVIYMFYARLRDIADELRKFRIAYEFAHERKAQSQSPANPSR